MGKKIGASLDSILEELQNTYIDVEEQKKRILVDYKVRSKKFLVDDRTVAEDSTIGQLQHQVLGLYNQALQKSIELIKIHKSLVAAPSGKEEGEAANRETPSTDDFKRIREEMKNWKQ